MTDPLLDEIKLAYESQKARPIRRMFTLHEKGVDYLCPLVVLAIHRGQVDRLDPGIAIDGGANAGLEAAAKTFGEDWTLGFLDGFDGQNEKANADHDYLCGYALGVAAANQLSPRDPAT
jgi:hypothetical protein